MQLYISEKTLTFFIFIFIITLSQPFYTWGLPSKVITIIYASVILLTIISYSLLLNHNNRILILSRRSLYFSILFLISYLSIFILSVGYEISLAGVVLLTLLLPFFFLERKVHAQIVNILSIILAAHGVLSLITFILIFIFGDSAPYQIVNVEFRKDENEFYKVYFGLVWMLNSQFWEMSIGTIARSSGLLREPGHWGILVFAILAIQKFDFSNKRNRWILLSGALTFSTTFYLLLFMALIRSKIKYFFIFLLFIIVFVIFIQDSSFYDRVIGHNLNNLALSNSLFEFLDLKFKHSEAFNYVYTAFGNAKSDSLNLTGDIRSFVYLYGIVPSGLYFVFITYGLYIIRDNHIKYYLILLFAAIFSHRYFLVFHLYYTALFFLASTLSSHYSCSREACNHQKQ